MDVMRTASELIRPMDAALHIAQSPLPLHALLGQRLLGLVRPQAVVDKAARRTHDAVSNRVTLSSESTVAKRYYERIDNPTVFSASVESKRKSPDNVTAVSR